VWNHEDPKASVNWRDSIKNDLCDMNKQQVWEIIKKENISKNRRTTKLE
jgi:hypothetical protein